MKKLKYKAKKIVLNLTACFITSAKELFEELYILPFLLRMFDNINNNLYFLRQGPYFKHDRANRYINEYMYTQTQNTQKDTTSHRHKHARTHSVTPTVCIGLQTTFTCTDIR